jgi:hypothetical protein
VRAPPRPSHASAGACLSLPTGLTRLLPAGTSSFWNWVTGGESTESSPLQRGMKREESECNPTTRFALALCCLFGCRKGAWRDCHCEHSITREGSRGAARSNGGRARGALPARMVAAQTQHAT